MAVTPSSVLVAKCAALACKSKACREAAERKAAMQAEDAAQTQRAPDQVTPARPLTGFSPQR